MEQKAVGKWKSLKPVVVVMTVNSPQCHGNVAMQDCEHKRKGKGDRSCECCNSVDTELVTKKVIWPRENKQQRHRHHPVDEADALVIMFA